MPGVKLAFTITALLALLTTVAALACNEDATPTSPPTPEPAPTLAATAAPEATPSPTAVPTKAPTAMPTVAPTATPAPDSDGCPKSNAVTRTDADNYTATHTIAIANAYPCPNPNRHTNTCARRRCRPANKPLPAIPGRRDRDTDGLSGAVGKRKRRTVLSCGRGLPMKLAIHA